MNSSCSRVLSESLLVWLGTLAGCAGSRPIQPLDWQVVKTGSEQSLRGLAVIDRKTVFVGGQDGTLLCTDDGGGTWLDVAPAGCDVCDWRDLQVFSRFHVLAMVAGQPARVYRTGDGGVSWQVVLEDRRPAAFFDAMAFAGDFGVVFGDAIDGEFTLYLTEDAGRTWQAAPGRSLPSPL